MNFIPLADRVAVKRNAAEDEVTAGGIFIPGHVKTPPSEAVVIAVGPDVKALKPGEQVLLGRYVGVEITIDNETLVLVTESEILGKIGKINGKTNR